MVDVPSAGDVCECDCKGLARVDAVVVVTVKVEVGSRPASTSASVF